MSAYIEAISAIEKATAFAPKPTRMQPYTMAAGPPFNKANWNVTANVSHEMIIITLK
jgi:hypothetical protein